MTRSTFFLFALLAPGLAHAGAAITFDSDTIEVNATAGTCEASLGFTNTGDATLEISAVETGLRAETDFPKKTAPRATGTISLSWACAAGTLDEQVTVVSNGAQARGVIRIKGRVNPAPVEQTTPVKETGTRN